MRKIIDVSDMVGKNTTNRLGKADNQRICENNPPIPDVSQHDPASALARKLQVETFLRETRGDASKKEVRAEMKREATALDEVLRQACLRGRQNSRQRRRAMSPSRGVRTPAFYAGLKSALHDAIVARFDPNTVRELELDALSRLAEIWRKNAEKKAIGA